jgi:hypothetical protein
MITMILPAASGPDVQAGSSTANARQTEKVSDGV